MTDDLRWAVRYAFLEDLWRDRPRVVVDAGLEAALRERPRARRDEDDPLDALVDALVPRSPRARTWMAVTDEAVARELAQTRPGTGFLPRSSFGDVVAHRDWAVALVELAALHPDATGGPRLREQLIERAAEGRTVAVSARSVPGEEDDDAGFAALSELLDEIGGGRIFGVYRPVMGAVIDFGEGEGEDDEGEAGEDDEGEAGEDDEGEGDAADEVPLTFDNTLGSQTPAFVEYVAVFGDVDVLPDGMTLVELPAHAPTAEQSSDVALRAQLLQAQRQAELAAIDRQALLEKVDMLESAQARLEQQAAELRDHLARAVTEIPAEASEAAERLQASLADNQALRWKVQQLERELAAAKARPVEVLEAEVAALRAELRARELVVEPTPDEGGGADDGSALPVEVGATLARASEALDWGDDEDDEPLAGDIVVLTSEAEEAALRIRRGAALAELDRLIERVERGGIGTLPLRQALISLRQRLR
ncbi:hypothetical protein [Paraliomyxa miuraensis]|uniref:hypothetical protein n=1 Tax=Paraliomyxa miuraensis TaxID=376150 RepID=UPI002250CC3E|nr:hypothetical protein [Paraliomyxa miuraensis]MCX4245487.1 hypothetical protein [Paraliomyxa miuraensis]